VQNILRLKLLHQLVGDEFVVIWSSEEFTDSLKGEEKAIEVVVLIELLDFGESGVLKSSPPLEFQQGGRLNRAFQMQVQFGLGKACDKRTMVRN
jgi:hypothetical protein